MYLYPTWIRIWHWLNALLFLLLILTGISMQYSNPNVPFIRFDLAVNLHNISGVIVTVIYFLFLFGNMFSDNGKHYKIEKEDLQERMKTQFKFYIKGIFQNEEPPFPVTRERKFNPLQKITYVVTMYILMPLIIITGWALLFPEATLNRVFGTSGLILTDQFHIIIGFFLSIFMIVHIYFATIGHSPGANFRSMVTGWHTGH